MAYGELTSNFSQILTNLSFSSQVLAKWMCVDDVGWRVASFMTSDISKIGLWSREGRFLLDLAFCSFRRGSKASLLAQQAHYARAAYLDRSSCRWALKLVT